MTQLWAIQSKLSHEDSSRHMVEVFTKFGLNWAAYPVIPFSKHVPDFNWDGPIMFYGSINMLKNVMAQNGSNARIFFDPIKHSTTYYSQLLGDAWLNYGASTTTIEGYMVGAENDAHERFYRPDDATKSFAGCVKQPDEFRDMMRLNLANGNVKPTDTIWIGRKQNIAAEYRTWIIDGNVAAVVGYKQNNVVRPWMPEPIEDDYIRNYATSIAANLKSTYEAYTLDVARIDDDSLRVVEINDIHCSGWYMPEVIHDVVFELSNYIAKYPTGRE